MSISEEVENIETLYKKMQILKSRRRRIITHPYLPNNVKTQLVAELDPLIRSKRRQLTTATHIHAENIAASIMNGYVLRQRETPQPASSHVSSVSSRHGDDQ